ncbi:hypothetical protein PN462_11165 [Spirulina sp. CS-785/01]|uniref:hypothetical protein n=1 Tax=Spirulina sp. CS-785/01 TaxID=3021716 RepID=UPI00232E22CF|nr:hypothetical protein [Spirulina sp. CS-785/01]MDB9313660.1 hypothetical protein [Spirulina sp. CS-785/01]
MPILGVNALLAELESHCSTTAIITFLNSADEPFIVNLERQGERFKYGDNMGGKEIFIAKLLSGCEPNGAIVLRSFTSEIDETSQLPIKELRGYVLQRQGEELFFEKVPANTMFACQNTDAQTGEPLPLEQAVRYC